MIDVAIVGAGFTGLWSAYYLLQADPTLRVELFEAEQVGFGASGRNGGWVSALWPLPLETVATEHGEQAAQALAAELRHTVDVVGEVAATEGIDAGYLKGGGLIVARGSAQAARARAAISSSLHFGEAVEWLSREAINERFAVAGATGATFHPDLARVHPGRLVRGLGEVVRRMGAVIHEGHRVAKIEPGALTLATPAKSVVSAKNLLVATEAWTSRLRDKKRRVVPVYSLMVATEPLSAALWEQIGLAGREVFADHGHLITYGQRTVDDRIAFGGRGAPYHFGSMIRPGFDGDRAVHARLRKTLRSWLPQLAQVEFTHAWGGPLGIARDWHPSVQFDPASRIGSAGGYVGDGVAATNLAGRTLADLVLGRRTSLTSLPWVNHRSPNWEPEPLRWLGVNAGLQLATWADLEERATRRPARLGAVLAKLTAH